MTAGALRLHDAAPPWSSSKSSMKRQVIRMNESRSNARAIPALAVLAFVAGVVFWIARGSGAAAAMFACSAIGFAASWFFAMRVVRTDEDPN